MKFPEGKGFRAGKWYANEGFRDEDINFLNEKEYTNLTALLATYAESGLLDNDLNIVLSGLLLEHNNLLTSDLRAGIVISSTGYYLTNGTWGFVASPGDVFSVVVPISTAVAVVSGGANDRIDVLEVRPIQTAYDTLSRNFKDPVTGLVTSSPVDTKVEYGFEFHILKGDDTKALTNEQTTFTVNASTVGSDIAGKYVLFSTVYDDYYLWFNTGASSDPAVSGRIGIEVAIGAADDDDAIALAARTEIDGLAGIVVSGTLGSIILTGSTYANLTDSTNGDTGAYFDTVSITQGNGATAKTAGWVKLAEIEVGASATSITQADIKDVRDSSIWDNDTESTTDITTIPAELVTLKDVADDFTVDNVEDALIEVVDGTAIRDSVIISDHLEYKLTSGLSIGTTRKWFTIAQIDDLAGQDTNGFAEFSVRTAYLNRDIKLTVSIPTNLSSQEPIILPISFNSQDFTDQNCYVEVRVVYDNSDNSEKGVILQISLRYGSSITDESIIVSMRNNYQHTFSGLQRKWELVTVTYNDSPSLPDGTVFGSATTIQRWCTGLNDTLIWSGHAPLNADWLPFTGFVNDMFNKYTVLFDETNSTTLDPVSYPILIEPMRLIHATSNIGKCYAYRWLTSTTYFAIILFGAAYTTYPHHFHTTVTVSPVMYAKRIWGRNG